MFQSMLGISIIFYFSVLYLSGLLFWELSCDDLPVSDAMILLVWLTSRWFYTQARNMEEDRMRAGLRTQRRWEGREELILRSSLEVKS